MIKEERKRELKCLVTALLNLDLEESEYLQKELDRETKEMVTSFFKGRGSEVDVDEINELIEAINIFMRSRLINRGHALSIAALQGQVRITFCFL